MNKLFCDKCNKEYEYESNDISIKDVNTVSPQTRYVARISKFDLGTFGNGSIGYKYDRDIDLCPKCKDNFSDIVKKFLGITDGASK